MTKARIKLTPHHIDRTIEPLFNILLSPHDVFIYAALKSSFVAFFAVREVPADGLNPLAISQTAKTSSCGRIGRLRMAWIVPKGGRRWNITNRPLKMVNVIPTRPQTVSHRGTSLN